MNLQIQKDGKKLMKIKLWKDKSDTQEIEVHEKKTLKKQQQSSVN